MPAGPGSRPIFSCSHPRVCDPQSAPDFLRSGPRRHTPSRRPHASMTFRSFEAVNGARIARRETGVSRRPLRAPACGGRRPLTAAMLRKEEAAMRSTACPPHWRRSSRRCAARPIGYKGHVRCAPLPRLLEGGAHPADEGKRGRRVSWKTSEPAGGARRSSPRSTLAGGALARLVVLSSDAGLHPVSGGWSPPTAPFAPATRGRCRSAASPAPF